MPQVVLNANGQKLDVLFPDGWLENNQLTQADFALEAEWLTRVGIDFSVR